MTQYTVARRHVIAKRKIQTVTRLRSLGMQNVRGKCFKATTGNIFISTYLKQSVQHV